MLFKALPVLLAFAAVPAVAAPAPTPIKQPVRLPAADPCAKAENGQDRAICLAPVLDAATKSLDATIAQLKIHFEPNSAPTTLFDASQDSWVKEMAQTCHAAELLYDGGDVSKSIGLDCQIQMTRDREKLIKTVYNVTLYH
jgi:uncharacterized protein YecT (DUF1311 family)